MRSRPAKTGPLVITTVRITHKQWEFVQSKRNKGLEFSAILRAAINQLILKDQEDRDPTEEEARKILEDIRAGKPAPRTTIEG
jgi:hypothetical protein